METGLQKYVWCRVAVSCLLILRRGLVVNLVLHSVELTECIILRETHIAAIIMIVIPDVTFRNHPKRRTANVQRRAGPEGHLTVCSSPILYHRLLWKLPVVITVTDSLTLSH